MRRPTKAARQPAEQSHSVEDQALWHDIECGGYTADLPLWRELVAAARKRSGGSCDVLEVGCGTGRVTLALAGAGCRMTAIDIEPALVEALRSRARERGAEVQAMVADARALEIRSSFDLVLAPMQLTQLLDERDRLRMLSSIARCLRPRALVALALLDLEEEWTAEGAAAPVPDMLEQENWIYSSQPVAVRLSANGKRLELDRVRRIVSPDGKLNESFSRVSLELVPPERLEREGVRAGLNAVRRRHIPATDEHVASTVVILENGDG